MKKYGLLIVALATCAFVLLPQPKVHSQKRQGADRAYEPNQILVKLKPAARASIGAQQHGRGRDRSELATELLPGHGYRAEMLDLAFDEAQSGAILVEFHSDLSVEEAILRAQSDPRVEYAEPNFHVELTEFVPNDLRFNEQWGLFNPLSEGSDINATRAWDITTGNGSVVVAIIDTGLEISHPDLAANVWVNSREVANNGVDDDNNGFIDDINGWDFAENSNNVDENLPTFTFDRGHGTHVAGVIGAVGNNGIDVAGVAWNVKLLPLPVFTYNQSTGRASATVSDIIKAMDYLIALKKRGDNVRVVNASIGASDVSQTWREAIERAGNRGILFVTSAGNTGRNIDQTPFYPPSWASSTPNILSVAALDQFDNLASFSNYGATSVAVGAPGVNIRSTFPGNDTALRSGTSQASPYVAGIAALLWSREPDLTPVEVKQRIASTTEPVPSLNGKTISGGRANAYNSLLNLPGSLPPLAFNELTFTKKIIYLKGGGFVGGSMAVEVNGAPVAGKVRYDDAFKLANGSFTEFNVKMGKAAIQETFPLNTAVNVTVVHQTTGNRVTLTVTRTGATQSAESEDEQPRFIIEKPTERGLRHKTIPYAQTQ